ncbi:hypothetical protein IIA28_17975 [candidate division KSB1 bacterium]|nr:hypothetical protein [candidate division KSB1 bacterium]
MLIKRPGRLLKNCLIRLLALALAAGCANTPKVQYSQLETSGLTNVTDGLVTSEYFLGLLNALQGLQTGDPIFKRNSIAYWITPEIDKIDLELTAQEEQFESTEYHGRLKKLKELHEEYLVFSLDLSMPFYSKWPQSRLIDYLQNNLTITLENGTEKIFAPELQVFNVLERFADEKPEFPSYETFDGLEVRVPVRVHFSKLDNAEAIVSSSTKEIRIKLRLKKRPPFRIGFFDEKFFQGFKWKVVHPG